jgi:hypothetical protein
MTTGQVMDTEKAPKEGSLDSVPFPILKRLGQLRLYVTLSCTPAIRKGECPLDRQSERKDGRRTGREGAWTSLSVVAQN